MTNEQKQAISSMREAGVAIPAISAQLGLSVNTIKSYCKRHGIHSGNQSRKNILFCLQCHTEIPQTSHRKVCAGGKLLRKRKPKVAYPQGF